MKIKVFNKSIKLKFAIPLFIFMVFAIYFILFGFFSMFTDVFNKNSILEDQISNNLEVKKDVGHILTFERLDMKKIDDQVFEYWELRGTTSNYAIIEIYYNEETKNYKIDSLKILETYSKFKKRIHIKYNYK